MRVAGAAGGGGGGQWPGEILFRRVMTPVLLGERIVSINGMAGCGAGRRARGGREQMWDCFMNYIDV